MRASYRPEFSDSKTYRTSHELRASSYERSRSGVARSPQLIGRSPGGYPPLRSSRKLVASFENSRKHSQALYRLDLESAGAARTMGRVRDRSCGRVAFRHADRCDGSLLRISGPPALPVLRRDGLGRIRAGKPGDLRNRVPGRGDCSAEADL